MLKKDYWKRRQNYYLEIFKESLPGLQKRSLNRTDPYEYEDDISRDLAFSVEDIVFSRKYKELELGLPTFQVYGQPDRNDKKKTKREDKCPDFMWTYVDYANRTRRDFTIECKRLKNDINRYSREYVANGLNRFFDIEWSYGVGCNSGLMIGYVEGLTISNCLEKIGAYLTNGAIPPLQSISNFNDEIHCLKHVLDRSGIPITPFELNHYFVLLQ